VDALAGARIILMVDLIAERANRPDGRLRCA